MKRNHEIFHSRSYLPARGSPLTSKRDFVLTALGLARETMHLPPVRRTRKNSCTPGSYRAFLLDRRISLVYISLLFFFFSLNSSTALFCSTFTTSFSSASSPFLCSGHVHHVATAGSVQLRQSMNTIMIILYSKGDFTHT